MGAVGGRARTKNIMVMFSWISNILVKHSKQLNTSAAQQAFSQEEHWDNQLTGLSLLRRHLSHCGDANKRRKVGTYKRKKTKTSASLILNFIWSLKRNFQFHLEFEEELSISSGV